MIHGVNSLKPLTSIKCENSKWIMLIYVVMIISMRHRVPTILFKDKYNNCWMKFFPLIEGLTLRSFVFRCVRKKKIHKLYMPMTCYTHSNLLSIPPQPSPRSAERNWITAFWVFYLLLNEINFAMPNQPCSVSNSHTYYPYCLLTAEFSLSTQAFQTDSKRVFV